jgi:hypothetical protein
MEQEYDAEVGRELGWDLARYGLSLQDDTNADVVAGYKAGLAHFIRPQRIPDRFERKWLQLRQNALRRGRVVQREVTPAFIRFIDHPVCPVTLTPMTHGLRVDTDWSIDRVNNDGAYAEGNLVVVSTLVNRAKANKGFERVCEIATAETEDDERIDGLTSVQWGRLASIMVGACVPPTHPRVLYPLLTRIPVGSVFHDFHALQFLLYRATRDASTRTRLVNRLNKLLSEERKAALLKVAAERLTTLVKTVDYRFDASLDVEFISGLAQWYMAIPSSRQPEFHELLGRVDGDTVFGGERLDKWLLGTKGYFADAHN